MKHKSLYHQILVHIYTLSHLRIDVMSMSVTFILTESLLLTAHISCQLKTGVHFQAQSLT